MQEDSAPKGSGDRKDSKDEGQASAGSSASQLATRAGSPAQGEGRPAEIEKLIREVLPPPEGRLEHREFLARGGMGRVDVVLDVALQRYIARKVIDERLRNVARAVRLFLREAQITGQLDHPAIVPVHEVDLDGKGQLYFTMKLVEGQSFTEFVKGLPEGALEPQDLHDLLEISIKVCDALAFAHSRGVIHGDVKPDNVMVGSFGEVYLMDWGLASLKESALPKTSRALRMADAQAVVGTPAFMAPEQAQQQPADERTDIFALGAFLYFALARRPPYEGPTLSDTLALAGRCRFTALSALPQASVSSDLDRIVMKAMSPAREDRHQTVSELQTDLKVFLRGGAEFPRRDVPAGEHVIRQGESSNEVYILVSGRVRVYRVAKGREIALREMGPGDVFGEMAILTSSPRTASVVAEEDCVLRVVTGDILEREMGGVKPWMAAFTRALARRLREREERSS